MVGVSTLSSLGPSGLYSVLANRAKLATTKSYAAPPIGPPMRGPTMYSQNPPRGPGIAIEPQPAIAATSRGPKSLAGLNPA